MNSTQVWKDYLLEHPATTADQMALIALRSLVAYLSTDEMDQLHSLGSVAALDCLRLMGAKGIDQDYADIRMKRLSKPSWTYLIDPNPNEHVHLLEYLKYMLGGSLEDLMLKRLKTTYKVRDVTI